VAEREKEEEKGKKIKSGEDNFLAPRNERARATGKIASVSSAAGLLLFRESIYCRSQARVGPFDRLRDIY